MGQWFTFHYTNIRDVSKGYTLTQFQEEGKNL
jgi:hypothetical protein